MTNTIPDFTEAELWIIRKTLDERYRKSIEITQADAEMRLDLHSSELTECPAVFWQEGAVNFVVVKTGERRYRTQFFYRVHQQFGTGIDEFDDLSECMVTVLQVQADHEAKERAKQEKEQAGRRPAS